MIQNATEPATLAVMAGVLGAAFATVTTLGKWGIESLKASKKNGGRKTNGPGFQSVDSDRISDTKSLAVDTNNRVREMGMAIETHGHQSLQEERRQTEQMGKMVDGLTRLETSFAVLGEKLSRD